MFDKSMNTKWAAIKTGAGEVTGYIEMFRGTGGIWVTIPGASRFVDAKEIAAATAAATAAKAKTITARERAIVARRFAENIR